MEIQSAKLIITIVDETTGELITREATLGDFKEVTKKTTTTRTKKSKDDGSTEPKLTLLEGKVQLNNRAAELVGWEPDEKIDIAFEKVGRKVTPVMYADDKKGNRLTKTFTISCRGSKNDNLSEYGTVFDVIPYEGKEGYFKLIGNNIPEDDIIDVPEEITNPDDFEINNEPGVDNEDFELEL